jgi:long-chain fatty acid transport protein
MRTSGVRVMALSLLAVLLVPALAGATNGYFAHGVGMKTSGMAGAGVAYPQDALAAGTNPAGTALVGSRFDVGLDWFRPDRGSEIVGSGAPVNGEYDANDTPAFYVPSLGVTKMMNDRVAVGLAAYGNGGMNTSYTTPIGLFGSTNAGVDLSQLFIVPTVAFKVNDMHSIGIGVKVGWQRFEATGLQNFDNEMFTSHPGKVTDNDYATSTGFGGSVGWIGQLHQVVTVGAAYQSRTYMGEFDEYAGLFAENGGFDIPASVSGGIAFMPSEAAVIAVDVAHVWYSDIKSIANPLLPNLGAAPLGDENGAGFGWKDVTTVKVGVAYDLSETMTVRAGYNYGAQPIPESETLFNMLAPGVVETHATLGGTFRLNETMELTFAYMHAFENTVEGKDSIPMDFGGGEANLTMSQDVFGLGFGMNF